MAVGREGPGPPVWFLALSTFVCGAAIMVIEILGARVIGPFFGVSLFVWTALIAVTMIALAAGYWIGGVAADRTGSAEVLFGLIGLAGLLTILVPFAKAPVLKSFAPAGLRLGAFTSALLLFGPPLLLLGCVSPWVVRLAARRVESVGRTAGSFYCLSTVGSIVGTVLAGFVLVAFLRVNQSFHLVGASLLLLSAVYFAWAKGRRGVLAVMSIPLGALMLERTGPGLVRTLPSGTTATLVASREGYYGNVRVIDYAYGPFRSRELVIDGLVQGGVDLGSGLPVYEYLCFMEFLPVAVRPGGRNCLVLGLGAGVLPSWYEARGIRTDVVELDPNVLDLARTYFGYRGRVRLGDARYLLGTLEERYDYVLLDVYNGDTTPTHLLGLEAFRLAKERLTGSGVLVVNLHGSLRGGTQATFSVVRTLERVFQTVDVYPTFDPAAVESGNLVLLAYDGPAVALGPEALRGFAVHPAARAAVERFREHKFSLPEAVRAEVLTDEFNPLDLRDASLREQTRLSILRDTHWDLLL